MNKIYRTVWNESTHTWVAVPETAKAHGKSGRSAGVLGALGVGGSRFAYTAIASAVLLMSGQVMAATISAGTGINAIVIQGPTGTTTAAGADSLAAGTNTSAAGTSAIAIGTTASASAANSLAAGVGTSAATTDSVAIGKDVKVLDTGAPQTDQEGSVAIGSQTEVSGKASVGIGRNVRAIARNAVAVGDSALATNTQAVAIARDAQASGVGAIAIGSASRSSSSHTTALGVSANANVSRSVALGSDAVADRIGFNIAANPVTTDESATFAANQVYANVDATQAAKNAVVATVRNTTSNTYGAVSVGNAGMTRQIINLAPGSEDSDAVNVAQLKAVASAVAAGQTHYYSVNDNGVQGSNYNNDGATGANSLAAGVGTQASGISSTAIGHNANASNSASVAVGWNTQASGNHSMALGGTSGTTNTHAKGDSSMAIGFGAQTGNGASWSVATGDLAKVGDNAERAVAMGALANVADGASNATAVGTAANVSAADGTAVGAGASATVANSVALGSNSVANVAAGAVGADPLSAATSTANSTWTATHAAVSVGDGTTVTRQITSVAAGTNDTDAVNVAQLKAAGFNLTTSASGGTAAGTTVQPVKNGDTFTLDAGTGIQLAQAGSTVTISTNAQALAEAAQLPVVYTNATGDKLYLVDDPANPGQKIFNTAADGSGTTVPAGNVITSMQNPNGSTTAPTRLTNVASTLPATTNTTTAQPVPALTPAQQSNAATVGDILNAGWNLQGNGTAADFVKPYDTVNFANGNGTTARVTSNGTTSNVSFDINTANLTTGTDGKVSSSAPGNSFATATDVANAINNSGFIATAGGNQSGASNELINPGDKLTLSAGDGLTVTQSGSTFTYAVNAQAVTNSAQLPVVYTNAAGDKLYKQPDGTFNTAADGSGAPVASTDVIASMQNATGSTATPTQLTNVAPAKLNNNSTDAVNGSQLYAVGDSTAKALGGTSSFNPTTGQVTAGLSVGGNSYTNVQDALSAINTTASAHNTVSAGSNIVVTPTRNSNGSTDYQVATNPNMQLTSVTTTDAAGNQTVTNGNGITITPAGGGNPVSLTGSGLDNGGNKITNVAEGTADTDAVNVSQLNGLQNQVNNLNVTIPGQMNARLNDMEGRINAVENTANAGVAQAIATAGLPQAYLPGKSMVAIGGGYYKGETGYAVGFSTISDGGNWIIKGTASGNSRGHFGASVGAGYQW